MISRHSTRRPGITTMELVIAFGLLALGALFATQLGLDVLQERLRATERLVAIETVDNALEAARALPWAELTPEWAAKQKLPPDVASQLRDARFQVQVAPEADKPGLKRVTVLLPWKHADGTEARAVSLTTLLADRQRGGDQ